MSTYSLLFSALASLVKLRACNIPKLILSSGAHAREWVSPAAALYLLSRLLESPALARGLEWRVLPLLNPDGYVYSWTHVRGQAM